MISMCGSVSGTPASLSVPLAIKQADVRPVEPHRRGQRLMAES